MAPSIDNSRTVKMGPGAPAANPLPPSMMGGPQSPRIPAPSPSQKGPSHVPPSSYGAAQALGQSRGGVNVITLVVVAIVCLLMGVAITAGVIWLSNR